MPTLKINDAWPLVISLSTFPRCFGVNGLFQFNQDIKEITLRNNSSFDSDVLMNIKFYRFPGGTKPATPFPARRDWQQL